MSMGPYGFDMSAYHDPHKAIGALIVGVANIDSQLSMLISVLARHDQRWRLSPYDDEDFDRRLSGKIKHWKQLCGRVTRNEPKFMDRVNSIEKEIRAALSVRNDLAHCSVEVMNSDCGPLIRCSNLPTPQSFASSKMNALQIPYEFIYRPSWIAGVGFFTHVANQTIVNYTQEAREIQIRVAPETAVKL